MKLGEEIFHTEQTENGYLIKNQFGILHATCPTKGMAEKLIQLIIQGQQPRVIGATRR